jgi:hypothetical protein
MSALTGSSGMPAGSEVTCPPEYLYLRPNCGHDLARWPADVLLRQPRWHWFNSSIAHQHLCR